MVMVSGVTSPSSYSCQCRYICHLARVVAGSCTYNMTVSVTIAVVVTRKKTRNQNRSLVHVY
jgi:hypothetical protein